MTEINTIPHIDAHEITHNDDSLTLPEVLSEEDRARLWSLNNEIACIVLLATKPGKSYTPEDACDELSSLQNDPVGGFRIPRDFMRRVFVEKLVPLGFFETHRSPTMRRYYFTKTEVGEEFATPFAAHLLTMGMEAELPLRDLLAYPRPPDADVLGGYPQLTRLEVLRVMLSGEEYDIPELCKKLALEHNYEVSDGVITHINALKDLKLIDEVFPDSGKRKRTRYPSYAFAEGVDESFVIPVVKTEQHKGIPDAVEFVLRLALEDGDDQPFKPGDLAERYKEQFDRLAPGNLMARRTAIAKVLEAAFTADVLVITSPATERLHKTKINKRGLIIAETMSEIDTQFTNLDPEVFRNAQMIRRKLVSRQPNPRLTRATRRGLPRKRT